MSCFFTFVFLLFIILIERSDGDDEDDPIYASQMSDTSSTTSQNGTTASPISLHELPPPSPRPTAITVPFPPITPDRSNPEELNSGPIHHQDGSESGSVVEHDASSDIVLGSNGSVDSSGLASPPSPWTQCMLNTLSPGGDDTATPTPDATTNTHHSEFFRNINMNENSNRNTRSFSDAWAQRKKMKAENSGGISNTIDGNISLTASSSPSSTPTSTGDDSTTPTSPPYGSSVTLGEVDASSVATGVNKKASKWKRKLAKFFASFQRGGGNS